VNVDDGYMRMVAPDEPLRDREVAVPEDMEERLVNMTRQQRRAWARGEQKRLAADAALRAALKQAE
jgi:acyl-CoA hydrolase